MKTFNEKDLITWSNHDKAIIGNYIILAIAWRAYKVR